MPDPADEHIASMIAAVRVGGLRWTALVDARRAAARMADRRACLLISVLCGVVLLGSVAACALTVGPAFRGNVYVVPVVVALFGLSGALPAYVIATAVAGMAVRPDAVSPARLRVSAAISRSGQALFAGTALGAVVAGAVVALNGVPFAAVVGFVVGAAVAIPAILGRTLTGLFLRMAAI